MVSCNRQSIISTLIQNVISRSHSLDPYLIRFKFIIVSSKKHSSIKIFLIFIFVFRVFFSNRFLASHLFVFFLLSCLNPLKPPWCYFNIYFVFKNILLSCLSSFIFLFFFLFCFCSNALKHGNNGNGQSGNSNGCSTTWKKD